MKFALNAPDSPRVTVGASDPRDLIAYGDATVDCHNVLRTISRSAGLFMLLSIEGPCLSKLKDALLSAGPAALITAFINVIKTVGQLQPTKNLFFSPLEPLAEKALTAVIQDAYIQDISTRSVDELIRVMGMSGISKGQAGPECSRRASRLGEDIDQRVKACLDRPIEGDGPWAAWPQARHLRRPRGHQGRSLQVLHSRLGVLSRGL